LRPNEKPNYSAFRKRNPFRNAQVHYGSLKSPLCSCVSITLPSRFGGLPAAERKPAQNLNSLSQVTVSLRRIQRVSNSGTMNRLKNLWPCLTKSTPTPSFGNRFTTTSGSNIRNGSSQVASPPCVIFTRRASWTSYTLTRRG
jgi:hypothetical protein